MGIHDGEFDEEEGQHREEVLLFRCATTAFFFMHEIASIERRVRKLKALARAYFPMADKAPIADHTELLRVFDIRGSRHKKHPFKGYRVYISRKSLKHFVEERKRDLLVRHSEEEAMRAVELALSNLKEVIVDFDSYEFLPDERHPHFFMKDYTQQGRPPLRVLVDEGKKKCTLEICSFHFRKK